MSDKDHNPGQKGTKRKVQRGTALTPDARRRFKQARRDAMLTVLELAELARVNDKVISHVENLNSSRPRYDNSSLTKIARALGKTLDELVDGRVVTASASSVSQEFDALERLSHELDDKLIPLIRDLRRPALASEAYQDILHERLRRSGLTVDSHLATLNGRNLGVATLVTLPAPDVIVDIDDHFAKAVFHFGKSRIEVPSPRLLWDCGCTTPEAPVDPTKCPIHKHPEGIELAARFNAGHVLFRFRDAQYRWRSHRSLWPPSFDSLAMYVDLERAGVFHERIGSILDLGCGTGFLGIGLALQNPNIVQVTLADWLLTPLLYSRLNWLLNRVNRTHVDVRVRLGLFIDWLKPSEGPFDLLVCNPPYLPLLSGFDDLGLDATVAGTDLLEHVIRNGRSLARRVYVQFSDLAKSMAREAAQQAHVQLVPVGPAREVPFRVSLVWKRREYLSVLQDRCGLRRRTRNRHLYWHSIQTYRVDA